MAAGMAADTGHSLSAQAIEVKVAGLLEGGLSAERRTDRGDSGSVTSSSGPCQPSSKGAAGSGKTTTLRPIADLYREHGNRALSPQPWLGARRWRLATMSMRGRSASTSCCASPHGAASRLTRKYHHYRRRSRDAVDPAGASYSPSSPSAMERRSSSRATRNSNNPWKLDRG